MGRHEVPVENRSAYPGPPSAAATELLLKRLKGSLWAIYVHVDRKTDISPFRKLRGGATFVRKRVVVNWGGLSQVKAAITLWKAAYADPDVTHFYHVSGQCYPVKSDDQIRDAVESATRHGANFMSMVPIPVSHKPLTRFTERSTFDARSPIRRKILVRVFRRLPDKDIAELRGIKLFDGSSWWLLERAAVKSILEYLESNPWYLPLFKFSGSPDEMVLHSLLVFLGIRISRESPTAAKWIDRNYNPEVMTEQLHQEFCAGPKLFARKYVDYHPASGA